MKYDDWVFRQAGYDYDDCTYNPEDEDSWCKCKACNNRRKYECEETQADDMFNDLHAYEFINGRPPHA